MSHKDSSSSYTSKGADERKRSRDDLYSAVESDVDRTIDPEADIDEQRASGVWKKQVLAGYKAKSSKGPRDTNTLLARIPDGKASYQVGDRHKSVSIQEAMIILVDRMFDAFQNYGYDFNKDATGSELELNWIRPVLSKEPSGLSVFSGRLSTRRWTMVVKGTPQEILAFILPADKLIGFSLSSTQFKPYLRMLPTSDGLDVRWKIDKIVIPPEVVPRLYQDLFAALIRNAQNLATGEQICDVKRLLGAAGKPVKIEPEEDVHQKYRDAFFQDYRQQADSTTADFQPYVAPSHDGRSSSSSSRPNDPLNQQTSRMWPNDGYGQGAQPGGPQQGVPQQGVPHQGVPQQGIPQQGGHPGSGQQGVPQQGVQNQGMPPQNPYQQQAPWTSQPNPGGPGPVPPHPQSPPYPVPPTQSQQHPSYPPAPYPVPPSGPAGGQMHSAQSTGGHQPMPPGAQSQPKRPSQTQQGFQNLQQQMQNMNQNRQPGRVDPNISFASALSQLVMALDRELEIVAKAGADAFAQKDLGRADAAIKFSARLNEFRGTAIELLEYYRPR